MSGCGCGGGCGGCAAAAPAGRLDAGADRAGRTPWISAEELPDIVPGPSRPPQWEAVRWKDGRYQVQPASHQATPHWRTLWEELQSTHTARGDLGESRRQGNDRAVVRPLSPRMYPMAGRGGNWTWGDPFPAQITDCGWSVEDYAVPLLDPAPCVAADGTPESDRLEFYLATGTTQTTRLPNGVYRMYFGAASVVGVTKGVNSGRSWPAYDVGGREKFAIDVRGDAALDYSPDQLEFWGVSGTDYKKLHFSRNFVGYIDSVDGINFPLYAPKVSPTSGSTCEDVSYAGAAGVLEEAATGFWAGWHSTSIRAEEANVVYRDVSVVYLAELRRYLMFAVECDGYGRGVNGNADAMEGRGCTLCVPADSFATPCILNNQPKTRYVFFTCPDPAFGANTMGPFPVAPGAPNEALGQWIGVPQAFLSPGGDYLMYYVSTNGYAYAGLHFSNAC